VRRRSRRRLWFNYVCIVRWRWTINLSFGSSIVPQSCLAQCFHELVEKPPFACPPPGLQSYMQKAVVKELLGFNAASFFA
jgi:hypothetical protein